jgi:hypothetical protein
MSVSELSSARPTASLSFAAPNDPPNEQFRSKSFYAKIHGELQKLSKSLNEKNEILKNKEIKLTLQEKMLDKKEKLMSKEFETLLQSATQKKVEQYQNDAQLMISNYEDAIEQLNKENKRLQQSLKEMVTTNRLLRDQNKSVSSENSQKEALVEELQLQLKKVF